MMRSSMILHTSQGVIGRAEESHERGERDARGRVSPKRDLKEHAERVRNQKTLQYTK